jgi:hypothetical protein
MFLGLSDFVFFCVSGVCVNVSFIQSWRVCQHSQLVLKLTFSFLFQVPQEITGPVENVFCDNEEAN